MQQRQPRLGDILDDYCPRERRVTNHAVVAMVGPDVKQTRCTTCDAEHDYKHAKVPRQRKKSDSPAVLYAQVLAGGPKKVVHEAPVAAASASPAAASSHADVVSHSAVVANAVLSPDDAIEDENDEPEDDQPGHGGDLLDDDAVAAAAQGDLFLGDDTRPRPAEEGPVHRRLIRAQLPRIEGQPPPARQAPEFTIRQPAGRINRFRPRNQPRGASSGGGQFQGPGNRSNNNNNGNGNTSGGPSGGPMRSGSQGHGSQGHSSGRPPMASRVAKRQGPGRKRSK